MTKKYPSTQTLKSTVESRFDVLYAWVAAHAGNVIYKGLRFPYTDKDLERCESDAKQIYNFARGKDEKQNKKAESHWEHVNKVFARVRAIAQWLEDKGGKTK